MIVRFLSWLFGLFGMRGMSDAMFEEIKAAVRVEAMP
jgi:hypothetical protein